MSKILRVEIDPKGAAFEDDRGEAGRILREASILADKHIESLMADEGLSFILRDVNGRDVGKIRALEPRRFRGHTLLIGGEMVTLWPVEIAGPKTYPPRGCTEPLVWFHHAENDLSEPCDIVTAAMVNRWGWDYASCDVSEHVGILDNGIQLKPKDRAALRDCGSANAEMMRKS